MTHSLHYLQLMSMVCAMKSSVYCLNFQGSKGNNVVIDDGTAFNLMAMHGHDVHVVCYPNSEMRVYSMSERQISMMIGDNVANTVVSTDYKGSQVIVYEDTNGRDKMHESMGCAE